MASKTLNKVVLTVGIIFLVHAAFSAAHYRTYLRLTEQNWTHLPLDVVLQTVGCLAIVVYNLIQIVGLKEIRATVDLQAKSWDSLCNLQNFSTFNHRGKALHPSYEPPMGGRSQVLLERMRGENN